MFCLKNFSNWISLKCIFSIRIIKNFIQYGTLQDRRHEAPGPSYTVVTEETVNEIEKYFSENPNSSIAQSCSKISKPSLHRIVTNFLKLYPYKITTHQLLITKYMEARVKFCKTITEMFESGEIDENKIVFSDETHFWLNGYVNKQNDRFWGTENSNNSISKSLRPEKVTLWATLSVKGIYLYFFDSTVTGNSYKELLETNFFPFVKKRGWVRLSILCKMEQRLIAPKKCSRLFTMYMEIDWLV